MPNNNGVFSLVPGYLAVPGTTIMSQQHNAPLEDIAVELNATVRRDGSRPMQASLPMGGNKITGLGDATAAGDAITFGQAAASVSPGVINMFGGSQAPPGSLLCNGAAYSRAAYPALFAVIGTTYGAGDGGTTFNVPNLQGRVPVGAGTGYGLGSTGGAATVSLTAEQLATHRHSGTTAVAGDHVHAPTGGGSFISHTNAGGGIGNGSVFLGTQSHPTTANGGSHSHQFITDESGSGAPHNNMQPYVVINYIIKT